MVTGVLSVLAVGQDRVARDAALWSHQITDAIASAGEDPRGLGGLHRGRYQADSERTGLAGVATGSHQHPCIGGSGCCRRGSSIAVMGVTADGGDLQRAVARMHAADPSAVPFDSVFAFANSPHIGAPAGADSDFSSRWWRILKVPGARSRSPPPPGASYTQTSRHDLRHNAPTRHACELGAAAGLLTEQPAPSIRQRTSTYYADLLEKVQEAAEMARTLPAYSGLHPGERMADLSRCCTEFADPHRFPRPPPRNPSRCWRRSPYWAITADPVGCYHRNSFNSTDSQGEASVILFITVVAYGAIFAVIDLMRSDIAGAAILVIIFLGS